MLSGLSLPQPLFQVWLVGQYCFYLEISANGLIIVTGIQSAVETSEKGPNQFIRRTDFHHTRWCVIAGIQNFGKYLVNDVEYYMICYSQQL